MPACDTTSSCEPVPPLAPIASMTLPSTMIGLPPREATFGSTAEGRLGGLPVGF